MSDFIIDADPFIPSGVPATVEEVAAFVVDGILPVAKVADLHPDQQPDSVAEAVAQWSPTGLRRVSPCRTTRSSSPRLPCP